MSIVDFHLAFAKDSNKCEEGCLTPMSPLSRSEQKELEKRMWEKGYSMSVTPGGRIQWIERPKNEKGEYLTFEEELDRSMAALRKLGLINQSSTMFNN